MKIIHLQNDKKEHREQYHKISSEILEPIFIENIFKLKHYVQDGDGIIILRDALQQFRGDRGAVLVGAGPSLDNDLKTLKEHNKDLFIITCDAALPVLLENGIEPNITVVTDHSNRQEKNFKGFDVSKQFIFLSSLVHPTTFDEVRRSRGRVLWYNLFDPDSSVCLNMPQAFGRKGALIPGVLTSSAVMQTAFWLGLKTVAFIGHDLAYSNLNKGYASDVSEEKKKFQEKTKINNSDNLLEIDDINGSKIKTHYIFNTFVEWLNDILLKTWPGATVYNCSQQGILQGEKIIQSNLQTFIKNHSEEGFGTQCQVLLNKTYYEDKQLFEYLVAPIFEGEINGRTSSEIFEI